MNSKILTSWFYSTSNRTLVIEVLLNDSDPDGDALTITSVSAAPNGTAVINVGTVIYTPNPDFNGADTFTYTISDGQASATATVTVGVTPVNDAPVALDDSYSVNEDSALNVPAPGVLTNDADVDGDALTAVLATDVINGTLALAADGSFSYMPDPNFAGIDTFSYVAADALLNSNPATVTITVNPVNDPPTAVDDTALTVEDSPTTIDVLTNDTDPDGDPLTVFAVSVPSNGTVVINPDRTVTYTPNPNFDGVDSFTYEVDDGQGGRSTGRVDVTVTPVNDPPVAVDDNASTPEDTSVTIEVLLNDSDPDGDALTITSVSAAPNGTAVINVGTVIYTPNPDFNGADTFTYTISDGQASATATVTVGVTPVNDAPVALDNSYSVNEDSDLNVPAPGVLTNDSDPDGDALTAVLATDVINGTLALAGDGSFTYTPDLNFAGIDTFSYVANDGTDNSNPATVTIDVLAINDPPILNPDSAITDEDRPVTLDILLNDVDPDGDPLDVDQCSAPLNGRITINPDKTVTYTPNPDFNGEDSCNCTVIDGRGGSATALVTFTVTPVNDPPVAVGDNYTVNEDQTLTIPVPGVLGNDTDVDGDSLTAAVLSSVQLGATLVFNPDGSFSYTPPPNFNGTDSFTYVANDGTADSNNATFTIDVLPVNDPPVPTDDSATTEEDRPVTVDIVSNDFDPDGDPLNVTECNPPLRGRITINPGSITYTPDPDFNGDDGVECMVEDGQGGSATSRLTITVTPVNDPPVAVGDNYTVNEDQTLTILVPGVLGNDTDVDGDSLTAAVLSSVQLGATLVFNPDGSFSYTPPPNFNGTDSFTYVANDGTADSNNVTFTIDVIPVNDPPVPTDDSTTTEEDRPVTVDIVSNDFDPDGDPLNVTECGPVLRGRITINPGSITYTPDPDFNGEDGAECMVEDGQGGSATSRLTITVTPVNDPPVAVGDNYTVNEDQTLTIPVPGVLGNDTDVDGDSLTAAVLSSVQLGATLVFNPDGSFSYTPPPNFNGTDSFTYVANDGISDSNNAAFTIDVIPVNDRPVPADDSATTDEDREVTVNILANDSDPNGDPLGVDQCTNPTNGRIVINVDGTVTYTPNPDFNGVDPADCMIIDGQGGSATSRVTFIVTPVNDPPVGVPDSYTVDEDQVLNVPAPTGVLANDTDVEGDSLTAILATDVGSGTLALNADGSFTYTPNSDFSGTDTFTYLPNDGAVDGNVTTVTIRVNPVNDTPVATDDNASTQEDTSVAIDVLANDSDPDGDPLTITSVSVPANGAAAIQGTGISYTPDPNFNGPDAFTYTISDGQASATATVTVDVAAVNDAPIAVDDSATTAEDTSVTIEVLINDSDPENDPITLDSASNPSNGTASINPNGTILYTPDLNFHGTDSFAYTISDPQGASATATVNVIVTPVNDPPIARDDTATTTEGTAVVINVLGNDSDVDGDTLSITVVTDPPSGSATINTDRTVTYNPDSGFTGTDTFSYTASDGGGLTAAANVTVTVNAGGIEVSIDIRPGNPNNRINLQSNGLLRVAIFSSPELHVPTEVDLATVTLAGAPIRVLTNGRRLVLRVDLNRDGIRDLLAFFPIQELELTVQDQTAVLRGRTVDGRRIRGEDSVQVSNGRVRLRSNVVYPSSRYANMQAAVDDTARNGRLSIRAGTYPGPIVVSRSILIQGAGCGSCPGARRGGRVTVLSGPRPTSVVDAADATGLITVIQDGNREIKVEIRDIALRGFDAAIRVPDQQGARGSLDIRRVSMAESSRGILLQADLGLRVQRVEIKDVAWNGISMVGGSLGADALYFFDGLVIDNIGHIGVFIVNKPGTCDSDHAIKNATIQSAKFGGIVVVRSGLCILNSTIRFNFFTGIRAIDSAVFMKDTLVSTTLPRVSDNAYGDGVFVLSTKEPRARLTLVDSEIRQSSRAGVTVFGSVAELQGLVGECNSLDINTEPIFLVAPPDSPVEKIALIPTLDDKGGNTCGCGAADPPAPCEAVSSQLTPPIGIGNQP